MPDSILLITSGVGPVEVRRFVAALAAHLEELSAARGLEVRDVASAGEDLAAPRSVSLTVRGPAAAQLADQLGTHQLVHRSAERGRAARKRWFAAVSLHPGADAPVPALAPPRAELEITACRAGGPGGQHVNKVATAVRVRHLPTGLLVRAASSRSQKANLDHALQRLAALLAEQQRDAASQAHGERRLAHYRVVRGAPIATYQLDGDGALQQTS